MVPCRNRCPSLVMTSTMSSSSLSQESQDCFLQEQGGGALGSELGTLQAAEGDGKTHIFMTIRRESLGNVSGPGK